MPIGYGSRFDLPTLSPTEIGVLQQEETGGLSELFNIILTIASIVVSFTPAGPFVDPIIAATSIGVDVAKGEATPLNVGLNLATGVLPGAFSGIKGIRGASQINTALGDISKIGEGVLEPITATTKAGRKLRFAGRANRKAFNKDLIEDIVRNRSIMARQAGFNLTTENAGNIAKTVSKGIRRLEVVGGVAAGASETGAQATKRALAEAPHAALRTLGLFKSEIRALEALIKNGVITNIERFRSILEIAANRTLNPILLQAAKAEKKVYTLLTKGTNAQRVSRAFGQSVKKGTRVLQYVSNPATVVSKIFEKTTGKLASLIEARAKQIYSLLAKTYNKEHKLEEEFLRTGGIQMKQKDSTIFGYKLIAQESELVTIMIHFNRIKTSSKAGKNVGGKKPVIVQTTSFKLSSFLKARHPMRFYLDNWARSRGGRTPGGDVIFGLEEFEEILAYLPIPAIQEYIGIAAFDASLIKNAANQKWIFTQKFTEGFKEGLIQGVIAEAVRLGAAIAPGRLGKAITERAISGAVSGQGATGALVATMNSERDRLYGESLSGAVREKQESIVGSVGSIKSIV